MCFSQSLDERAIKVTSPTEWGLVSWCCVIARDFYTKESLGYMLIFEELKSE